MVPFESLKALSLTDEKLLCGRADVIAEIVDNCRKERLTVLTAEPGLGVTSLLRAGVAPALRREGFIVAVFSEWQGRFFGANLNEAIASAVREEADPLFYAQNESLDELLANVRARTGKPVAILLDQFEDYVRCHANTVLSDQFEAELANAISTRKGSFVVGIQDHALRAFECLGQYIPNLLGYRLVLPWLTVEAAREAVLAEARSRRIDVEPNALEALVTAPMVTTGQARAEIHPFYLKLATGVLFDAEARRKSTVLQASTIEGRGGADRVVLEAFDPAIAELDSSEVELLFRWCNILISPEKHRLSVTEEGLNRYAGELSRFAPHLLELLTASGILRQVETSGALRYEISRECFTPVLRDWWERREALIVARRRARFRVMSLSIALSAIVLTYVLWLIYGKLK